jgi:hypothetical protein
VDELLSRANAKKNELNQPPPQAAPAPAASGKTAAPAPGAKPDGGK